MAPLEEPFGKVCSTVYININLLVRPFEARWLELPASTRYPARTLSSRVRHTKPTRSPREGLARKLDKPKNNLALTAASLEAPLKWHNLLIKHWLPPRDSNPDMLLQRQLSYH